jgi:DNA polymerase III subunit epsilon
MSNMGLEGKHLILDLETTGLDPFTNGVHQIAGIIIVDNQMVDNFDIRCRPLPTDKVEDEALAVGGITREQLMAYQSPEEAFIELTEYLSKYVERYVKPDKFFLYGYNVKFDSDFLRQWFLKQDNKFYGSWFWHPPIDIMTLAMYYLRSKRSEMVNFKLETVAGKLGVKTREGAFHEALTDCYYALDILSAISADIDVRPVPMKLMTLADLRARSSQATPPTSGGAESKPFVSDKPFVLGG